MAEPGNNNSLDEREGENGSLDNRTGNLRTGLGVFILLFLLVMGMLVYYQFYQGHGRWRFTLLHKANDTTFLLALKNKTADSTVSNRSIHALNNVVSKKDSTTNDSAVKTNPANAANFVQPDSIGTVYEVQIGIFENYELKKYDAVFNNLHEEKVGQQTRLTLGQFKTFEAADAFKRDMMRTGVKGAWVVKKVNGKRVSNN